MYHFLWVGTAQGLTVWGAKIITPYTSANTDGIDAGTNVSNITITRSYISNGDDQIAINGSGATSQATNISITHMHTYGGRGISIGSSTSGGVSNVLVNYLSQSGNAKDVNGNGFRIKSAADRGGLVQNVTYQNVCQRNEMYPFRFDPYYVGTTSRASIPMFQNITLRNVTVLPNPTGMNSSISRLWLVGFDANHPTSLILDNVNVQGATQVWPTPGNVHITLGPGPVTPAALQSVAGTGVLYSGSVTNPKQTPYVCSATSFAPIAPEFYLSAAKGRNLPTLTVTGPATFTLNAVLEPTTAESAALTSPVTFYEGSTAVGTATLSGNGTLASLQLSGIETGTHYYTAVYPADANYPATTLGPIKVVVR